MPGPGPGSLPGPAPFPRAGAAVSGGEQEAPAQMGGVRGRGLSAGLGPFRLRQRCEERRAPPESPGVPQGKDAWRGLREPEEARHGSGSLLCDELLALRAQLWVTAGLVNVPEGLIPGTEPLRQREGLVWVASSAGRGSLGTWLV